MNRIRVEPDALGRASVLMWQVSADLEAIVTHLAGELTHLGDGMGPAASAARQTNDALREALERLELAYGSLQVGLTRVSGQYRAADRPVS